MDDLCVLMLLHIHTMSLCSISAPRSNSSITISKLPSLAAISKALQLSYNRASQIIKQHCLFLQHLEYEFSFSVIYHKLLSFSCVNFKYRCIHYTVILLICSTYIVHSICVNIFEKFTNNIQLSTLRCKHQERHSFLWILKQIQCIAFKIE